MIFVLDASVAVAWLLPDERTDETDALLAQMTSDRAIAPTLFRHEIRSILLKAERRGRLPASAVLPALGFLRSLPIADEDADEAAIVGVARRHGLTGYDAAYLALAQIRSIPLATQDAAMKSAARAEHVTLL